MAALWMVVASLLFAGMGVCVKLAAAVFSAPEIVFYRGVFSLLFTYFLLRAAGISLKTPHPRAQLLRGVSGFLSLLLYFYAITMLPLATAVTLNYTSPLFLAAWLALFSSLQLRQSMVLALVVGLAGVALLLRPTLAADQLPGGLIALASGVISGLAYFNVRELGLRGEPEARTVFYFALTASLLTLPWLAAAPLHLPDGGDLLLLLGVGGFATLAQLAMTRAYRYGKPIVTASLAYTTIIFASLLAAAIWDESLPGSAWLGIALIIASGIGATAASRRS